MAARPTVTVIGLDGATGGSTALPQVFSAPIRADIVQFVHTNMAKNKRQARCVNVDAGKQSAAESWGTGRAVSRIPRVPGGGTHRAGQGAFGNMCRKGHMFAPTKTWRKWHRKININQKRYAVVSALAASAVAPLVMARGHRVEGVSEIPLVLDDSAESLSKTAKAVEVLKAIGAYSDVEKSIASKNIRSGKGKMRNRRYTLRKGPLVIYGNDSGLTKAFRNLPGVDLCSVDALNLLQLAPGGHLGRFCIWTKSAISKIDTIYSSESKKNYVLPRSIMANSDLNRVINSDEIQSIVNAPKESGAKKTLKRNPLKNLGAMLKLNPYAKVAKRAELKASASKSKKTAVKSTVAEKFYKQMIADSEYDNDNCVHFTTWLNRGQ